MKKYFSIILFVLILTGCSVNQTGNNGEQADNSDQQTTNKNEDVRDGDKQNVENVEIIEKDTINGISIEGISKGDEIVSPALIMGKADVESVVVELRDSNHETKVAVPAKVYNGEYRISEYWFNFRGTKEGYIAVYEEGNKENIIEIAVNYKTVE